MIRTVHHRPQNILIAWFHHLHLHPFMLAGHLDDSDDYGKDGNDNSKSYQISLVKIGRLTIFDRYKTEREREEENVSHSIGGGG